MHSKLLKTASTFLFSVSLALGMLVGMSGTAKAVAVVYCPWVYYPPSPTKYCPVEQCGGWLSSKTCQLTYNRDDAGNLIVTCQCRK